MIKQMIDQLNDQFKGLVARVSNLEQRLRLNAGEASVSVYNQVSTWANRPTSPRTGQQHFFSDKAVPGGSLAGVLGVWSGAVWIGPNGDDISTY